jgi:thiamine kinase-like enzyme
VHDGLTLTFWTRVEVLPRTPTPDEVAAELTALHGHLAALPVAGAPLDTPLDDLSVWADRAGRWGVPATDRARMLEQLHALRPRLGGPAQVLHGDAHPGNLLATRGGWRWTDLEDTCAGPVGWDLACLRLTSRLDGRAALDAMDGPSDAELAPWLELRRLHAQAWTTVVGAGAHTSGSAGSR